MLVRLDASAFGDERDLCLLGMFAVCERTGHGIRVEVGAESAFETWISQFPRDLREELERIADEGSDTNRPREMEVLVDARASARSRWRGPVPTLSAADALAFLLLPLTVVVENGINDRNFLLAFTDTDVRRYLEAAETKGRLRFVGPGGIAELEKLVLAVGDGAEKLLYRSFFLCDSDAQSAGTLDGPPARIDTHLRVREKELHLDERWLGGPLQARAAENYAPPGKVAAWAVEQAQDPDAQRFMSELCDGSAPVGRTWPKVAAAWAFSQLLWPVRAHLCLKYGREKANGTIRTAHAIWAQIPPDLQTKLYAGFGKDFSAEFYPTQRGLRHGDSTELAELIDTIRRRL